MELSCNKTVFFHGISVSVIGFQMGHKKKGKITINRTLDNRTSANYDIQSESVFLYANIAIIILLYLYYA